MTTNLSKNASSHSSHHDFWQPKVGKASICSGFKSRFSAAPNLPVSAVRWGCSSQCGGDGTGKAMFLPGSVVGVMNSMGIAMGDFPYE
jgi:hypothetical protein